MAQEDDGGVVAAARQANGPEAHPIAQNVAGAVVPVNGVAPDPAPGVAHVQNMVGNVAAAVAAGAPVAAMLAPPAVPNLVVGVPPRFDVDAVLLDPLPTRSNFMGYEIHPWLE